MLEVELTPAQSEAIRPFFTRKELHPLSLESLYDIFTSNTAVRTVESTARVSAEEPTPNSADFSAWESVPTSRVVTETPELNTLAQEFFGTSQRISEGPSLFRHAFLLFLAHKQKTERHLDYDRVIQKYVATNMAIDVPTNMTDTLLTHITALLSPNTEFLGDMLEMRVFLTLHEYPIEFRNPKQLEIFQFFIKEFHRTLKRSEEGRVGAKVLWEAFLIYLRKYKLDFVGFFGSQTDFNEQLRELGWEQKRVAAGKVWMNMEFV